MTEAARTVRVPDDHAIVLFGASGDLARRMLLPGLFHLCEAGLMPEQFRIIGCSRNKLSDDEFRDLTRRALEDFGRRPVSDESFRSFAQTLSYVGMAEGLGELVEAVAGAEEQIGGTPRRLHYLSVPPSAAPGVIEELGSARLNERARVILEKPFGVDLESARRLNATVHSVFDESQVFRIDHFLGKEAVQNILALRFANGLFEPIWNRDHVDHVQIDVPETLSIGTRAGFYEQTGAFRDMVVTHLFQVLGFVAMEPPVSIHPGPLVTEKQKVFDSMEPIDPNAVVRGQYRGYRETEGVPPDSENDTFVALQVAVDNWRWAGVPFFLRTGKCLAQSRQVVTLGFKEPPRRMFELDDDVLDPNLLTLDIGDPGAISATFLAKQPGPTMLLDTARMEFAYDRSFGTEMQLEPYERLLHDAMTGDRTLFNSSEGIERLWEISEPVLRNPPPVGLYEPGTWGPPEADQLVAPRHWHVSEHA